MSQVFWLGMFLREFRCEFSLQGAALTVEASAGIHVEHAADGVLVTREPSADPLSIITAHSGSQAPVHLVVLSSQSAAPGG